jgi:hypothetical protein
MTALIDHAHAKAAFGHVELRDLSERTVAQRAGAGGPARQW